MPLQLLTGAQFVSNIVSAIQSATTKIKNFTTGSIGLALAQAQSSQLLVLQQQNAQVYALTRAATSNGADLTSFVADYLLSPPRLPALAPSGSLTFSRFSAPSATVYILVGTLVQTKTLPPAVPVIYQVVADSTNAAFDPSVGTSGGFAITNVQTSVTVAAQAVLPAGATSGTAYNVIAGALAIIQSVGTPADTVSNALAITNGVDQESDPALRVRFQKYIASLAKGTEFAIEAAVLSVQAGITYTFNDLTYTDGSERDGFFTVVVDDGTGSILNTLLATIKNAVLAVRAAGIKFDVIAPTNVTPTINVSSTIVQPGFNAATVRLAVQNAIVAYCNANGVGGANVNNQYTPTNVLSLVGIAMVIETFVGTAATQGLVSGGAITINSAASDLALTSFELIQVTSANVTVS